MNTTERLRNELETRFPTIESPRSVFVELDPYRARIVLHQIATKLNMVLTTRMVDGQLNVWRIK